MVNKKAELAKEEAVSKKQAKASTGAWWKTTSTKEEVKKTSKQAAKPASQKAGN